MLTIAAVGRLLLPTAVAVDRTKPELAAPVAEHKA